MHDRRFVMDGWTMTASVQKREGIKNRGLKGREGPSFYQKLFFFISGFLCHFSFPLSRKNKRTERFSWKIPGGFANLNVEVALLVRGSVAGKDSDIVNRKRLVSGDTLRRFRGVVSKGFGLVSIDFREDLFISLQIRGRNDCPEVHLWENRESVFRRHLNYGDQFLGWKIGIE